MNQKQSWQKALSDLITDPEELLNLLDLNEVDRNAAHRVSTFFPLKVTHSYVNRMQKSNPNDPLLKQVLPLDMELQSVPGYEKDPLQELKSNPIPGVLHKYRSRILITLTSACAIHCRFCFRRHFPYHENNPGKRGWDKLFAYIQSDTSIQEVILSGGDPLTVSDQYLNLFTEQLAHISHVKRLRIHTRLPIVLPERITDEFLQWLKRLDFNCIIVLHVNHPQEINEEVRARLSLLKHTNVTLLNQSVLLKGINDDVKTLSRLSEALFAAGVLPYYLHLLDKVAGAHHFDVDHEKAYQLHQELKAQLSGYLVPRLVFEKSGELSKLSLEKLI